MVESYNLQLKPRPRGFHIITNDVLSVIPSMPYEALLHVFIQHTSAALTINEGAAPDVRTDFSTFMDQLVPDGNTLFRHTEEGPDDMSAHIKAAFFGSSVSIPIASGQLLLGTWQEIYLCEFRDRSRARNIVVTIVT